MSLSLMITFDNRDISSMKSSTTRKLRMVSLDEKEIRFPAQAHVSPSYLTATLQNTLTRDVSETTYDAIVCATGYERHSWLNLLKSSGIGKHFGHTHPRRAMIPAARLSQNSPRQTHSTFRDATDLFRCRRLIVDLFHEYICKVARRRHMA